MGLVRLALEFRMELAGDKEGMVGQLNNLDQLAVRGEATEHKACLLEPLPVGIVEFVAMPMALLHHKSTVQASCLGSYYQLARLGSEPHCATFFCDFGLLVEHRDHRVRCIWIELRGMGFSQ